MGGTRWVVVAEEEVLPATTGGRVDHRGFLAAALAAGVEVLLVVPTPEPLDAGAYAAAFPGAALLAAPRDRRPVRHLSASPYVVASRPFPADLPARILALGPPPTAVVSYSVRSAHLGCRLADGFVVPHLVRCQNLDSAYFRDLAAGARPWRRPAYLLEARKLRRFERHLDASPSVTAFADVSADEAALHRTRTRAPVLHVPSFALPSLDGPPPDGSARAGVVFVGSLDVETNLEALRWLLDRVWPQLRSAVPDAVLTVVGRRPGPALRARVAGTPGAVLYGDVADVTPYLRAAAVVVNPARTGAGINVKLLQGMACGCAAVSTSAGATGLGFEAGRELEVADDPGAFAAAVVGLLEDPERRGRLAAAGEAFVRERLDPARNLARLAAALTPPGHAPQRAA